MRDGSVEKKRLKGQYRELLAVVSSVLAKWDPYSLLTAGAPAGEFDAEAARIAAQVDHIKSAADAAQVISEVFSAAFEPREFGLETRRDVGAQLFAKLEAAGFVGQR